MLPFIKERSIYIHKGHQYMQGNNHFQNGGAGYNDNLRKAWLIAGCSLLLNAETYPENLSI